MATTSSHVRTHVQQRKLVLTTLSGKEVFVLLPKEAVLCEPAPTNSLEFLAFAGSTLSTLLFPLPPVAAPTPFHIGEVTNLTCKDKAHKEDIHTYVRTYVGFSLASSQRAQCP